MRGENLSNLVNIRSALDYASGSADRDGAVLDMQGGHSVLAVVKFATIAAGAVTTIKMQQGDQANLSDAVDLEGTGLSVAADDDNQVFWSDLYLPTKRYVRLYIDKDGSNATAEMAFYIQYGPKVKPCDNNIADTITGELHVSPDAGTA